MGPSSLRAGPVAYTGGILLFLLLLWAFKSTPPFHPTHDHHPHSPIAKSQQDSNKMGIFHIVMFRFKESASAEQVQDALDRMLALRSSCIHPTTNEPYVRSIVGGKDNSPEGLQNGITHAFIVEFENDDDRKYYLKQDPKHIAFTQSLGPVLEKVQVVDFVPGSF